VKVQRSWSAIALSAVSLLIAFALVAWLSLAYQRRQLVRATEAALESQAIAEAELAAALAPPADRDLRAAWAELSFPRERRLTVIAPDGVVLYDSVADPEKMENHNQRPEVLAARARGEGTSSRLSHTVGTDFIYAAKLLPDGRVVRVAVPFAIQVELERGLFRSVAMASVVVAVAAAALVSLNVWRNRGLFLELREVSRAFARGEFARRARFASGGAFGKLALELNQLGERLEASLAEIAASRSLLDSALGALTEGVACIDRVDRVVYANTAYRQLAAGGAEVVGQLFYEHLPADTVSEPLTLARAGSAGRRQSAPFEHRRRHLQMTAASAGDVAVLVLHDLTEIMRTEQSRRDFMAAVSHEFKTPLTSIQGFAETLLDGAASDTEVARDFVAKIARQAERLSGLVRDVLTLARIEQGGWEVRPQLLDLVAIGGSIVDEFQPMAEARGVKLVLQAPERVDLVGDGELLRHCFGNLMSNAIRYNRDNGTVWLRIEPPADGRVTVTVQDTGIGIPLEHRERVFERFYRVDPNRSRQTGGTGLGLAIVKQLTQVLRGELRLESDTTGTRFTVTLPLEAERASVGAPT
jgi:two-component system phosphate regulon sensor histidine kinase PhoR